MGTTKCLLTNGAIMNKITIPFNENCDCRTKEVCGKLWYQGILLKLILSIFISKNTEKVAFFVYSKYAAFFQN